MTAHPPTNGPQPWKPLRDPSLCDELLQIAEDDFEWCRLPADHEGHCQPGDSLAAFRRPPQNDATEVRS